jgi:orotidine-5'-phosphate decarboxylase
MPSSKYNADDRSVLDPKIIVAIDKPDADAARALANALDPTLCRVKIGKESFVAAGPQLVENFQNRGFSVFLDLKFHDIPNTVAEACKAAARLGVWMVNVHAAGGRAMMQAARSAIDQTNAKSKPKLIGVTVLTSMRESELNEIGVPGKLDDQVSRLAKLSAECGLDGVVCSALEAVALRREIGSEFLLVTPGIRLPSAGKNDQVRIVTPQDALRAGASYLVIGRPITAAIDPRAALEEIYRMTREKEQS